eukprot:CAMPEP_0194192704 /NCGR_PEP_ID=MMETSP0154-20130528/71733_1 /TAXON_ID=1049557 /ORGANISM="Thalassiothrix antarctica, Strain L6-D1" /LENGTH=308 /DNA_ID=CAMNT_0038916359 /DNA_START=57 /DNA_END=983 /DNA_ORIENTATION=+
MYALKVIRIIHLLPFFLIFQIGCDSLVIPLSTAKPAESLNGISLEKVNICASQGEFQSYDIGAELSSTEEGIKTMLVFGTHAGDFNTIEYMQKLRSSLPELQAKGIKRFLIVVNGKTGQCKMLAKLLDLPEEIELFADPTGEAGRKFGVSRGFRPDDESMPPFVKQFFSGIGIGPPWMTLPAVLPGYFGDPNGQRGWIETSLKQGQEAGRWPAVLEFDGKGNVIGNKFDNAPLVSDWGQRPFELATLRLQNLIGIQIKHWSELRPVDDRCLTQYGGCTIVGPSGESLYSWVDRGLCDVPNMFDILETI